MNRRLFVKSVAVGAASLAHLPLVQAALPKMKITRVRAYAPPSPNPLFNQADSVITIETDAGITGIGEGGFPDALRQCAGRLIGQDPQHIERADIDADRAVEEADSGEYMIIPLGQSDHKESGHFDDQAEKLFSKAIAKPTFFLNRKELEKHVTARREWVL